MTKKTVLRVNKNGDNCIHSLSEALGVATGFFGLPVEIRVAPGIYRERIVVSQPLISIIGENAEETIITFNHGAHEILADGVKRGTFRTQTAFIEGDGFIARNVTFENAAGRGADVGQAIALYVDADRVALEGCRLIGSQDTLFAAPLPPAAVEIGGLRGPKEFAPRKTGTHLYRDCYIEGDVDFIFGGARAYFERCVIHSRDCGKEVNGYVAAPCTPEGADVGFVFDRCVFTSDCPAGTVYLGRPWREHAKIAVIGCELGAHIHPAGFHDWGKTGAHRSIEFVEYGNRGPGAEVARRAPFSRQLSAKAAEAYTAGRLIGKEWNLG